MKHIYILVLTLLAISASGQIHFNKPRTEKFNINSGLRVVYTEKMKKAPRLAYFLNDKFLNHPIIEILDRKLIDSLNFIKGDIEIDNIKYSGQIRIKTKSNYSPKIISLTDLKDKYADLKNKFAIFMIDGEVLNVDYDKYLVDENYLLTIVVDKIENSKENLNLNIIKLLTKSDENIQKSKKIMIRGTEVALVE